MHMNIIYMYDHVCILILQSICREKAFSQIWEIISAVLHRFCLGWFLPGLLERYWGASVWSRFHGALLYHVAASVRTASQYLVNDLRNHGSGSKYSNKKLVLILCSRMQGSVQQRCWFVSLVQHMMIWNSWSHGELISSGTTPEIRNFCDDMWWWW